MIESIIFGILLILVVVTYITKLSKKEDKDEITSDDLWDMSVIHEETPTLVIEEKVSLLSNEPTFEEQQKTFASMTVPELKSYVKENKNKLGESKGRMPTKKAELIEASLRIWTQEK